MLVTACSTTYETHYRGYGNINNFRMYYELHGDGEALLLLHGGTSSGAESWSEVIPVLAREYQVIVPDSRAHGRSTDTNEPLSYDALTDDLIALLDHLGIERAHAVGWSDGGINGINMAMRYPERVGKVVAYGSNFHYSGLSEQAIEAAQALSPETWTPWIAEIVYRNIAPDPGREAVFLAKVRDMWLTQPDWTVDDLARIENQVLVLEDSLANAIRPDHTAAMVEAIHGAELILIDGTDHAAPQDQPETFNRHVLQFLKR
jgi:pimeloyl-ACP methyl ester carboxylesterase